jgi:hypothetical protein
MAKTDTTNSIGFSHLLAILAIVLYFSHFLATF